MEKLLDSVQEGDGKRLLSIWKYLLIFKARKRSSYSKEAAILLLQYHFIFSDRLRMQLLTSRFINTKGRVGCNLPSDLHMEHLNRRLKEILHHQGSNIKPSTLVTSSRVTGIVDDICKSFESEVRRGKQRSSVRDLEKIKEELMAKKVFEIIQREDIMHFHLRNECRKQWTTKMSGITLLTKYCHNFYFDNNNLQSLTTNITTIICLFIIIKKGVSIE